MAPCLIEMRPNHLWPCVSTGSRLACGRVRRKNTRQGGDLEAVFRGIRTVVARKRGLRSKTPLVNFRFIVMGQNEHEIPCLRELAQSLGVDALTLKTLNYCLKDPYVEDGSRRPEGYHEFLPRNQSYQRFKYDSTGLERVRLRRNPCKQLWCNPTIHRSGSVVPCTFDPKEKYILGDVRAASLRNIWSGPSYRQMRRQFRTDWEKIGLCSECSYAYQGGNLRCETIADAFFFNDDEVNQQE